MTNAEWMIKNGYKFSDLRHCGSDDGVVSFYLMPYGEIVGRVNRLPYFDVCGALKKWLDMEHKEHILNDAEKKYLSAVIKPFRDRVIGIKKLQSAVTKRESIIILILKDGCFGLPWFDIGTMYRGMERERTYTLDELEL